MPGRDVRCNGLRRQPGGTRACEAGPRSLVPRASGTARHRCCNESLRPCVSLKRNVCRKRHYSRPSSRMRRQRVVRLIPRTRAASWRRQRQASSAPRMRAASTASASARRAAAGTARLRAAPAGASSTLVDAYDAVRRDLARQVVGQDRLPLADGDRVLERVLELAHVAGPRVLEEQAQHVGREAQRAALARAHPREQEGGERLDVLAPLAQRAGSRSARRAGGSRGPRGSAPRRRRA